MDAKQAAEVLRWLSGDDVEKTIFGLDLQTEALNMGASALERLPALEKERDELIDCLTRAMEELGIAYLVTEEAPEDQRAIMNCLMKHGRVVIDGDRYGWAKE